VGEKTSRNGCGELGRYISAFADLKEMVLSFRHFVIVIILPHASQWRGREFLELALEVDDGLALLAGTSNEPLQNCIQIRLFFRTYAIAAHFTMGDALQIQRLDQLVDR
jgi:hypothetical protein